MTRFSPSANSQGPGTVSILSSILRTAMRPIIANITTSNIPIPVASEHNHFVLTYTTHQMEHFVPKSLVFFSSFGFPERGAFTVRTFNKQSPKTVFSSSTLSLCLSTLTTVSTHFSATNIPTPSDSPYFPSKTAYTFLPIVPRNLQQLPLRHVSWIHATSTFLSANVYWLVCCACQWVKFQISTRNP